VHLKEEAASPLVALHFYDDVPKALQPLLQPGLCLREVEKKKKGNLEERVPVGKNIPRYCGRGEI
jgi:hypothetical protein